MKKELESKPKNRISFRPILIFGIIITCIVANILSLVYQEGGLTAWKSLPALPEKAVSIIEADRWSVWVETDDNRIFSLTRQCALNENCNQWHLVNNTSDIIPADYGIPLRRDLNCSNLDNSLLFPNDPVGEITECVMAAYPGPGVGSLTYFALMADGSLKYWKKVSASFDPYFYFCISTFLLPGFIAFIIVAINASNIPKLLNKKHDKKKE